MFSDISNISTSNLIQAYSQILKELKLRGVIRTKNLIGDLGEYLVLDHYNTSSRLPKLTLAAPGTKSIDAISREGKRYAIKSTSSNLTGVFYGLQPPGSTEENEKIFDFVIIAMWKEDFRLTKIIEITWDQFLRFKRWHSVMQAWNITINKALLSECTVIFQSE